MSKKATPKEVRDSIERLSSDGSKGRSVSLSELTGDEFFERFEILTELSAKAREKYGYGIHSMAVEMFAEDPRMSEKEFWQELEEYWDGLTPAARKRCREQKPPPLICGTGMLNFGRSEEK